MDPVRWGIVLATIMAAGLAASAQTPSFRSAINLTTVTATVTDSNGHLVTGLKLDSFEVFEDGDLQTVTQFSNERVPVSLVVLLDVSDSMFGQRLADARAAIEQFVPELLASGDEYGILAFNHRQRLVAGWTTDPGAAAAAIEPIKPFGSTAIYDAIVTALPLAESRQRPRMALVVISDGADTASDVTLRDLRAALLRSDVFVYAVAIDAANRRAINAPVNSSALAEVTDQSGGRTMVVRNSGDLTAALLEIAEELKSQYLIGYSSPKGADGRYHTIRVRVRGTAHRVRARNGYVASAAAPSSP